MSKKTVSEHLTNILVHTSYLSSNFGELAGVAEAEPDQGITAQHLAVLESELVSAVYTFDLIKKGIK